MTLSRRLRGVAGCILACSWLSCFAAPSIYFVSDLHLGVGRDATKNWDPIEDFRWHDDLQGFLNYISSSSGDEAQLIVLGDMFELWQSSRMDCPRDHGVLNCIVKDCVGQETGCSASEVEVRLANIISHHRQTLSALGAFAARGNNRLIIVPGNHDAALLIPAVAQQLQQAISAPPGRVTIEISGRWLSPDSKVLAEHGHQFDEVNSFDGWPKPFTARDGQALLARPAGELLVQTFYNRYERQFPTIDNFATESAGAGYAMKELRTKGVVLGIADFAHLLRFRSSIRQRIDWLGDQPDNKRVEWDVTRIKRDKDAEFVLYSLESGSAERQVLADAYAKGQLAGLTDELKEDEIAALCDRSEVLAQRRDQTDRRPQSKRCPQRNGEGAKLGYFANKLLLADDVALAGYLRKTQQALLVPHRQPSVYVYGHTHSAKHPWKVEATPEWSVTVVNTGAFQRIANDRFIARLPSSVRDDTHFLSKLQPEQLPACYSFVKLTGKPAEPTALRFWRRDEKSGNWGESVACDR